jgi:hypothetical protein
MPIDAFLLHKRYNRSLYLSLPCTFTTATSNYSKKGRRHAYTSQHVDFQELHSLLDMLTMQVNSHCVCYMFVSGFKYLPAGLLIFLATQFSIMFSLKQIKVGLWTMEMRRQQNKTTGMLIKTVNKRQNLRIL